MLNTKKKTGMELKKTSDGSPNKKYVDLLDEDSAISGQKFVCLSFISPENEIGKSIERKLEAPGALDSVPFVDNKIRLLEILIKDNCKSIDIKFNELTKKYPKLEANIIGINREDKFFIPKKTDSVKKEDKIYVIINSSQMAETLKGYE